MSRIFPFLCLLAGLMTVSTAGHAFDGQRKGFILGFGAGPSMTSFTQTISYDGDSYTSDRENKIGAATDFKIGAGLNEQFLIYYVNRMTWFSLDNIIGESVIIGNSVGLLGVSYYLQETSPSPYILGLVGMSTWDAPFESDSDAWIGFGIGAGFGYEFSPHWSFEGTINYGNPGKEEGGLEVSSSAFSICATINFLAY
jgi:opacity protein-like surface antigen